jgi:hypothetical protein
MHSKLVFLSRICLLPCIHCMMLFYTLRLFAALSLAAKCLWVPKRALKDGHHPALQAGLHLDDIVSGDVTRNGDSDAGTPDASEDGQLHITESSSDNSHTKAAAGASSSSHASQDSSSQPAAHSDSDTHDQQGEQDVMVPLLLHPVVASLGADYIGRSKLTCWQVPTANHHGGWCMCVNRGLTEVCIYELMSCEWCTLVPLRAVIIRSCHYTSCPSHQCDT